MGKRFLCFVFFISVALAGLWFFQKQQPAVAYHQCELCDGVQYQSAYEYFAGKRTHYQVDFPFHSRVMVPWLVAQFQTQTPQEAFRIILWMCTLITIVLLLFTWRALHIPWYLHVVGVGWLLFHWVGIIRFNMYDPITVDAPLYVFHSLLVLLLLRPRWLWLLLIVTPIATAQKESWLAIVLLLTLYELIYQRFFNTKPVYQKLWIYGGALILAIATKWGLHQWFEPSNGTGKNSLITVLYFVKITLQNPLDLVRWVVALFIGFGGIGLLAGQKLWNSKWTHNQIHTPLALLALLHIVFGILAGRDMTRIMFLGFPFIVTGIFLLIRNESTLILVIAIGLSLPILRLVSIIPSQVTQNQLFKTWFPEYASLDIVSAWGVYMIVAYWLIAKLRTHLK